jgi:3-dehydroquinate dehydratase II
MAKTILLLNGPNLNLLGLRQPEIYGKQTLQDVEKACAAVLKEGGIGLESFQSNSEAALIDRIHKARGYADAIIINPGAYSHTSIALLDALNAFDGPVVEVHISQIFRREAFRHHSYVSGRADAVLCGLGVAGYAMACEWLATKLKAGS